MYNSVIDAFKDFGSTNSQLHHLGYRDKAWNVNKLAHIARKQGLHDVCVSILDKMYGHSTMEVQVLKLGYQFSLFFITLWWGWGGRQKYNHSCVLVFGMFAGGLC